MSGYSFRSDLRRRRPDMAEDIRGNELKRKLALALRALRKKKGLTQKEVEHRSNLSQSVISRLEAPTGSLPNWDTIMRYVKACGGHMLLGFSVNEFDEDDFVGASAEDQHDMISAVTV